jgi:hypothetical protein
VPSRNWTAEEVERLRRLHGTMKNDEILAHFPGRSSAAIRGKVTELGIGTRQDWTPEELEDLAVLAAHGVPTRVIARIFGRPPQAINVKISKEKIFRAKSANAESPTIVPDDMRALAKGTVSEALASVRLIEEGFQVFRPFKGNHLTDLLAISGTRALRLQVKTASHDSENKRYRLPIGTKRRSVWIKYEPAHTHAVIVVCRQHRTCYVIPTEQLPDSGYLHLYPYRANEVASPFERWREAFAGLRQLAPEQDLQHRSAEDPADREYGHSAERRTALQISRRRNFGPWEDQVIHLLLPHGIPTREVARLLNRDSGVVRRRASQLGINQSRLDSVPSVLDEDRISVPSDSHLYGAITEARVVCQLALAGVDVFLPVVMNERADAVALVGGRALRLQIKGTSALENAGKGGYRLSLARRGPSGSRPQYAESDFDFLLVKCGLQEDLYVIPWQKVVGRTSIVLYPHRHVLQLMHEDWEEYRNRIDLLLHG